MRKQQFSRNFYFYFSRFSKESLSPPINNSKKPQLTSPVKSLNSELQEKSESRGL